MQTFESAFPKDFRKNDIEQILRFVLTGKFCQLICLPGGGKATLLKLLAENENVRKFHLGAKVKSTRFVYLNLHELPNFDQPSIDEFLLHSLDRKAKHSNDPFTLAKQLNETVSKAAQNLTLVLLFDHFDEFTNKLSRSFFQTLRSAKNNARYKFACVFATRRDLRELIDPEILKEFYDFFVDNTVYMKLYDQKAIDFLFSQIKRVLGQTLSPKQQNDLIALTSGHTKLTKVSAETILQENIPIEKAVLLGKPIIRAALFELWLFLTAQEQKVLSSLAQKKPIEKSDAVENLLHFDLLRQPRQSQQPSNLKFTIPLFEEFVQVTIPKITKHNISYNPNTREITKGDETISDLLSPQENRLLMFLIENQGRIIEREEIIHAVWPEAQVAEGISDEAIDQMIFRLRKKIEDEPNNPSHIETVKGRGFRFQA